MNQKSGKLGKGPFKHINLCMIYIIKESKFREVADLMTNLDYIKKIETSFKDMHTDLILHD